MQITIWLGNYPRHGGTGQAPSLLSPKELVQCFNGEFLKIVHHNVLESKWPTIVASLSSRAFVPLVRLAMILRILKLLFLSLAV